MAMNQSETTPAERINCFEDFWPFYVREHSHSLNRVLHFVGSSLGLICLMVALILKSLWLAMLSLVVGYAFAWFGHFFIEHNKPATFKYPLWSFRADWKMWWLMLKGQMPPEIRRVSERV